jgi:hypothetical protein
MLRMRSAARADLGIERIEAARRDADQYLPGRRCGLRQIGDFEWAIVAVEHERLHRRHDKVLLQWIR